MAGTNTGFDSAAFNAGIKLAMDMGAPVADSDKAKFYFPATGGVVARSADGVPWNPAVASDAVAKTPVLVSCAVEYAEPADQATHLGSLRPTHIKVTLLEADYLLVEGCSYVAYGGERYEFRALETHALFDAGIRTMHFVRTDV